MADPGFVPLSAAPLAQVPSTGLLEPRALIPQAAPASDEGAGKWMTPTRIALVVVAVIVVLVIWWVWRGWDADPTPAAAKTVDASSGEIQELVDAINAIGGE